MRIATQILTVIAVLLLRAPASPQDRVKPSPKERIEASAKKVKELQKERIATLKQMADALSDQHRASRVEFVEVLEARLLVLKAELDAAEKESDRITLYKSIVDVLKEYEEVVHQKVKTARGTQASALKVKARRLEAEINLERAKAKEAKEAK